MRANQRITLTKRLLQEALLRLIDKKPLDKITVKELCEESDINRTTFYRHYSIPRDVLIEMEVEFSNQLYASFHSTDIKDISNYIEKLLTYLYEHSELLKIFIENNSDDDLMRLINDMFENFIKIKSKFTDISKVEDENLKLIATYIVGGGYFMLRRWLMEDIQKTPKEISDLILAFMNYSATFFDTGNRQNQ